MNDIASSGVIIAVAGWILYQCRSVGTYLTSILKRQIVMSLTVVDHLQDFRGIYSWVSRRMSSYRDVQPDGKDLVIAPGWSWFWYGNIPVVVNFMRENATGALTRDKDTLQLTFWGGNRETMQKVLAEAAQEQNDPSILQVYVRDSFSFNGRAIRKRPISTVSLPAGVAEDVLSDARHFLASAAQYAYLGVPHRRGFLFEGLPGTGKTSLALAVASELNLPIFVLQLGNINDDMLYNMLWQVPKRSIVLYEDVDCITASRQNTSARLIEDGPFAGTTLTDKKVTLSGLLNAIDGIVAPIGSIAIFTTNVVDTIDKAMLRPGRVDRRWNFTHLCRKQAEALVARFGVHDPTLVERALTEKWTACVLQEELLRHVIPRTNGAGNEILEDQDNFRNANGRDRCGDVLAYGQSSCKFAGMSRSELPVADVSTLEAAPHS